MLQNEELFTLARAARKTGLKPPPHPSTLWRWARVGVRGVKLEVRKLGGRIVTSVEALDRFGARLAELEPEAHGRGRPRKRRSRATRERAIREAEKRLEAAGI